MRKVKVIDNRGDIVEQEIIENEEERILVEQSCPKNKVTLEECLAKGHVPLEEFVRELTGQGLGHCNTGENGPDDCPRGR